MELLIELQQIKKLLDSVPSDSVTKRHSSDFNRAKNQLEKLISYGEMYSTQKGMKTVRQHENNL